MIGKKLGNRYEIKEKLGSGGMSIVYKGLDTVLNRMVTIKVLRDQYASDEDFVRRFRREAQSVASLSHPNIVSIFDVGYEENLHYLVMEFVEGQNLKEYIRKMGKLPVDEALPIVMQILDGLEHAHENGVVHRDIKPHNILLTNTGRVKVTDFGIARAASETTLTYSGTIVGSVHYISPEQAKGSVIGAKADIYAAGVVLFEMLTGRLPFTGDSPIAIALQHIQNDPPAPDEIVKEIPAEVSQIVRRAMQKNPDLRFGSAREMRRDLERVYQGRAYEVDFFQPEDVDDQDTMVLPALDRERRTPRRKTKPKSKWMIALIGTLMFLVIAWAGYMGIRSFLDVAETTVPPVEGKPLIEAKAALEEVDLECTVERSPNSTVPKDYVITQSIEAGQVVKKNRVIGLLVSDGPLMTTVPILKGKTEVEAKVELSNRKLQGSFSENFSSEIPKGMVISQQPGPGAQVPEGSSVSVVISVGIEPKYVSVPKLVTLTLEDAKKELKESGLEPGTVKQQDSTEYFSGQVISQNPEEGALILQGEPVNLVVSQGPGPMADIVRVTYEIPDDGKEHRFKIVVEDVKGTHTEYERVHAPGDLLVQDVPFYSKGQVIIYMDGKAIYRQNVPPGG